MPGSTMEFLVHPSGEPQPWTAVYNGIAYPGEVVSSYVWEPKWGEPLGGDTFFRIVFLSAAPAEPDFNLRDSRTAVCLPGKSFDLDAGPLGAEVRSIREAGAAYATRPGEGAQSLGGALAEAEQLAQQHMLDDAAQGFAEGTVIRSDKTVLQPGDLADGPVTQVWVDALAERLLADAYPLIPNDGASFPSPLDTDGVALLFQALFASHPTADALDVLRGFAPWLGLTPPGYEGCSVLDAIQEAMDAANNAVAISTLMDLLTRQVGLPRPLATLFVLVFIARNTPGVQASVGPQSNLRTRERNLFLGDRITWDVLSTLEWSHEIVSSLSTLTLLQPPTWLTVLPYAQQVVIDVSFDATGDAPFEATSEVEQQAELMSSLQALQGEVDHLSTELRSLSRVQGTPLPAALLGDMDILREVAAAGDYIGFCTMCVRRAASPTRLGGALGRVRGIKAFAAERSHYQNMVKCLEAVPVAYAPGELLLMREALLAQLALGQLVEAPSRWAALRGQGDGFIRQYITQYRAHHVEYHRQMVVLRERLDRAETRISALERLNGLAVVGPAVYPELPEAYRALEQGIHPCGVAGDNIAVDRHPICKKCGLNTGGPPPEAEVEDCLHQLGLALETKMARLREQLVGLVLDESGTPPVERFLRVLRAADVDALPNALDDRVAEFLKTLLPSQ